MPSQPHIEVHIGTEGQRIDISCSCPIGRDHDYETWTTLVRGDRYSVEDAAR